MPPFAYIGEGGNIQHSGDVCGSVCHSVCDNPCISGMAEARDFNFFMFIKLSCLVVFLPSCLIILDYVRIMNIVNWAACWMLLVCAE